MKGFLGLLLASVTSIASAATPAAPGLTYLYSLNCTLGQALPVGAGPHGTRTVIPITGGTFSGPRLSGKVLNLGADWGLIDKDGTFSADTRYHLQTDDNAHIFIRTAGPAQASGKIHLRMEFETGDAGKSNRDFGTAGTRTSATSPCSSPTRERSRAAAQTLSPQPGLAGHAHRPPSQTYEILPDLRRKVASAPGQPAAKIIRSEAVRPRRVECDGTGPTPNNPQQGADTDGRQAHQPQVHPQFTAEAAAAAVAAAHHGLQALQAAVAAPAPVPSPSPATSQHASLADASSYLAANNVGPSPGGGPNAKATRLRRACDMCSQRKVKCDETQPCKPCIELGVDCTFNRTMKRRGPPNKHAEAAKAAKQQRLEPNISPGPHNAAETLISISGGQDAQHILDAESIAPWPVLTLLIDDFFTYIHPLAPFPHEPTFRMSFTAREDRTNRAFLGLLASMIGALVASFPRTARLHLKTHQHGMHMYPKSITLVDRCRTVALEARGASFGSKDDITVHDAATSYFIALAAAYTMRWKLYRRFMAESMTFIRELGYHKPRDLGSSMFGVTYRGPPFNHVEDQLGKRMFWCLFLGLRSMYQLGTHHSDLVLAPPNSQRAILGQPDHSVSLLTGFNQGIKIYLTMNGLVSFELAYGISSLPFHDQQVMLDESLQAVKQVMDNLPPELTIDVNLPRSINTPNHGLANLIPTGPQGNVFDDGNSGLQYCPIGYQPLQQQQQQQQQQLATDFHHTPGGHPERRRVQYEIQKANIYASQLATRSYYVERGGHCTRPRSKTMAIDTNMAAERELIVQHLLTVLASISHRSMEPNGGSLINKIRQVASTLVNDSPHRKGPVAIKAEESLSKFVELLMRLERIPPGGEGENGVGGLAAGEDEEQELRTWADLREHQARFVQCGGFLGLP
ncbi:hypothetical protein CHGG_00255 [Chaetomium globosum CBS 148.51]|uniref:Zn(2)-C6 fungal-type domain-containing protein n=1 Tax=Chaetomium globosum (strain ATCC 6205 / CBS 148.51 / DSM 1962 / NBRC 6347 / NRRL 1970) TaxID=306901 RepID=Q2HHP9_CHAGB|nr:uncharacterized protein CHGG_00255 [Chaetomium globosum CBS 148.51]EAQ92020.1 hypothetical protein CHGG_00255 [Chaetomium globosum CBS 148.51]